MRDGALRQAARPSRWQGRKEGSKDGNQEKGVSKVALGPEPEPAHVAPLPHHPPLAVQAAPGCVANVVAIQPTYTHQTRTVHQTAEPSTEQPTASAQVARLSASTTQRDPKEMLSLPELAVAKH